MRTNQEILDQLRRHYPASELAEVLRRLLRVPEAWEALRTPEFLESALGPQAPAHITPAHLAAVALGGEITDRLSSDLAADQRGRLNLLSKETVDIARDLKDVGLMAIELIEGFEDESTVDRVVAESPEIWRSPLALAWTSFPEPEVVLGRLLSRGETELAAHVVLSNLPAAEAASYLARNANGSYLSLITSPILEGESVLLDALVAHSGKQPDSISEMVREGVLLDRSGDSSGASRSLQQALSKAEGYASQIAEQLLRTESGPGVPKNQREEDSGNLLDELRAASRAVDERPTDPTARLRYALLLARAGDPGGAQAELELAIGLEPESGRHRKRYVEIAMDAGDPLAALEQLENISDPDPAIAARVALAAKDDGRAQSIAIGQIEADPASAPAHVVLAKVHAMQGDPESAGVQFEEAIRLAPEDPQAHLAFAEWQLESGDIKSAGETLSYGAQAAPGDAQLQSALSDWMRAEGRQQEALKAALAAADGDVRYAGQAAQALMELGHLDQALELLRTAQIKRPLDWSLRFALAEVHERRGESDRAHAEIADLPPSADAAQHIIAGRIKTKSGDPTALQHFEIAESNGSTDPELDLWYAAALESNGDAKAARDRFRSAQGRLPQGMPDDRELATLGFARMALALGDIAASLDALQAHQPVTAKIHAQMSEVYREAELSDRAIEAAEKAIALNESEPAGWRALSASLLSAGEFQRADEALQRLGTIDPRSTDGWLELATLSAEAGLMHGARRALAHALHGGRRNPDVLAQVASAASAIGLPDTSRRMAESAVRERPEDPLMWRAMAQTLEVLGDEAAAAEAWIECAERSPLDAQPLIQAAKRTQDPVAAIDLLERAAVTDPRNVEVRRSLAQAHIGRGAVERGLDLYSLLVRQDAQLANEAAEAALLMNEPVTALEFINAAGASFAESGRASVASGEAYLLLGRHDQAQESLTEAVEADHVTPGLLAMLAILALHRSGPATAGEAMQQASEAQARSARDAIWIARAHLAFGNWAESIESLEGWPEPVAAAERARIAQDVRDAGWLYEQFEASAAAPDLKDWSAVADHFAKDVNPDLESKLGPAIAAIEREQADAALESIKEIDGPTEWAALIEGLARRIKNDSEAERAAYRKALQTTPLARFGLGRAYDEAGQTERAAKHIERAVAMWPGEHRWQHRLAELYVRLGDHDAALAHFQGASLGEPQNAEYRVDLAKAYQECGHAQQAYDSFQAAFQAMPGSVEEWLAAADVALEVEQTGQALDWYERALERSDDTSLPARVGAAQAASALGSGRLARKHLRAASRQAPDSPEVWLGEAQILANAGQGDAALNAFDRALSAGADPIKVLRSRGKLLQSGDRPEEATAAFEQALRIDPENHSLWHDLALASATAGDRKGADRAMAEALRIAPLIPEYRVSLARILRQTGQLDRALDELAQAAEISPDSPELAVETGQVFEARKEFSRALDSYREAISSDESCLDAYYRAGLLLRTMKDYSKAGEMLKQAAAIAPVNEDVMHQLAAVRALELVHG